MVTRSLVSSLLILSAAAGCGPFKAAHPIPKEKEAFIGSWCSAGGFRLEISTDGTARVHQLASSASAEYEPLSFKVAPRDFEGALVEFERESVLTVVKPLNYAREYHIDRTPFRDRDTTWMVLNGVTFRKVP